MRVFDWRPFLEEHAIPYITRGPNVSRGETNIRCPFCGSADPSFHMGLNPETGWWSCWRNRTAHSGKSPVRLIMKLLSVSFHQAREIAGLGDDYVDPEGFDAMAARILNRLGNNGQKAPVAERRFLELDPGFLTIKDSGRTRLHWNYLYNERGFNTTRRGIDDVDLLVRTYNLRAGVSGVWDYRIILPYYLDGELVTWSGRAIGTSLIRYRDLEVKESLVPPKEVLFNGDCIHEGGRILVVQEGPFDALKVDYYGSPVGVRSVGMSTNSISEEQAHLLKEAETRFDQILIVMDNKTTYGVVDSMRMRQELHFIKCKSGRLPDGVPDGGALSALGARQWAMQLLEKL